MRAQLFCSMTGLLSVVPGSGIWEDYVIHWHSLYVLEWVRRE